MYVTCSCRNDCPNLHQIIRGLVMIDIPINDLHRSEDMSLTLDLQRRRRRTSGMLDGAHRRERWGIWRGNRRTKTHPTKLKETR
jgi:hypothetical protein